MRGIPNDPVQCTGCGEPNGCPGDHKCHRCRIKGRPNPNKKYEWTNELDQAIRRAYQASSRRRLSENIDYLERLSRFSRASIMARAAILGLAAKRRKWTVQEVEFLSEAAGSIGKAAVARKLNRSYASVKAEFSHLQLSSRVSAGYSQGDVAYLLGAGPRTVRKWVRAGWLSLQRGRISEASLIKFIRQHPEEYQLSRVDEAWFKGMLFPGFGRQITKAPHYARVALTA